MITQDFINGYIAALRSVEENLNHRAEQLLPLNSPESDYRLFELSSIKQHLEQLRESYKQLVKSLNEGTK
jgi:hypothetical protein